MRQFRIPPRIAGGQFGFGDIERNFDEIHWYDLENERDNGEGMIATGGGKTEIGERQISFTVGYRANDRLPFISYTLFAPAGLTCWCSFSFEEVL